MASNRTAQDVIEALGLTPHPEKGHFIETFRDRETNANGKSHSTCIYYLLEGATGASNWHRVRGSVEVWHHYAGAPLQLSLSRDDGSPTQDNILGKDIWAGEKPQIVVQSNVWQHALSLGDWTLVGCTVAPAFTEEAFEMAKEGWEPRGRV
ncbi:cupin family protein [Xylariaceae sp. FL1019]|nr:cupin family protein [Xylariaceae sp. FL1019]